MARRLSANAYATRRAGRPWCSETVPATWPRRERHVSGGHVSGGHVSGAWSIDGVCFLTKRWTAASTYLLTPTYVVTPHPRACVGWRVPAASTSSPHPRVAPLWRVSAASATGAPSAPRRILPRRLLPVGEGARRFSHHPLPFDRAAGVVAEGYITNPLRQRSQGASRARLRMHVAHPPGRGLLSLPSPPANSPSCARLGTGHVLRVLRDRVRPVTTVAVALAVRCARHPTARWSAEIRRGREGARQATSSPPSPSSVALALAAPLRGKPQDCTYAPPPSPSDTSLRHLPPPPPSARSTPKWHDVAGG